MATKAIDNALTIDEERAFGSNHRDFLERINEYVLEALKHYVNDDGERVAVADIYGDYNRAEATLALAGDLSIVIYLALARDE